jgi:serine/threonine protein kinase
MVRPETDFGRYRLIEMIGQGGMGRVYKAFDSSTNRVVALKVLPEDAAANVGFRERFQREANAVAGLREPHIVPIHDFGEIDGRLYLDMRLIDGVDAATLVANDGPLDPDRAVAIIDQVAAALDSAHAAGLVHRDIKPSNILISDRDFVYLIDFGIARAAGESGLTSTGTTIGTFAYMAPERFTTGAIDHRADVYALACVLHELLTGRQPFPGDSIEQQIAAHMTTAPPAPSLIRAGLLPGFDDVIAHGMAKDPVERFATAGELAAAAREATTASKSSGAPTEVRNSRAAVTVHASPKPVLEIGESHHHHKAPNTPSRRVLWLGGAALAVIAALLLWFIVRGHNSGENPALSTPTLATQTLENETPSSASSADQGANAKQVEVMSFVQTGDQLNVRLRNPNQDVGLVRSPFELAMRDESGTILTTVGQGGLPGAVINTIYQLPPGGEYGLDLSVPKGNRVAAIDLSVLGTWLLWNTVNPPIATISNESMRPDPGYFGPVVTGQVSLDKAGPSNVHVVAFVKTPAGTVISKVTVNCVTPGQNRAFETSSFADVRGPYELEKVVAYPTSVVGAGPQFTPQC